MKNVLIPLVAGCEELEAVTLIDILRRGGIQVVTASLDEEPVLASRGVILMADTTLDIFMAESTVDMVVIPGGMGGAVTLVDHDCFVAYVQRTYDCGGYVCAICAAPMVLGKAGLLEGRSFTAYPGVVDDSIFPGSKNTGSAIEIDGRVLTSRGPGTALDFALILLGILAGTTVRDRVEKELVRS